mgnify:CR=1 FL=1
MVYEKDTKSLKNLLFQYYIPYEAGDSHYGGVEMPKWARTGSGSASCYAKHCGAEYVLSHDRHFKHLDPRLDSLRLVYDESFHELGVHTRQKTWLSKVMDSPGYERGIISYGKKLFGEDWMFPKSKLYPGENFRYLNGGFQLWSREGRKKARKHFKSVDDYYLHTRYTEQMYINLQLSQPVFNVTELDTSWNRLSSYQKLDGKINHYIGPHKRRMT